MEIWQSSGQIFSEFGNNVYRKNVSILSCLII